MHCQTYIDIGIKMWQISPFSIPKGVNASNANWRPSKESYYHSANDQNRRKKEIDGKREERFPNRRKTTCCLYSLFLTNMLQMVFLKVNEIRQRHIRPFIRPLIIDREGEKDNHQLTYTDYLRINTNLKIINNLEIITNLRIITPLKIMNN